MVPGPAGTGQHRLPRRDVDADQERRAQAEAQVRFDEQREALRRKQDEERARKEGEANKALDPYSMPFVPPQSPAVEQPQPAAPPVQPTSDPVLQALNKSIVAATVTE